MNNSKILFLLVACLAGWSEGYRILCLFPFNGKSHFIMFDAMCKGLARRGHQVDMISHFPTKTPRANFTDVVDLSGTLPNVVNSFSVDYAKTLHGSIIYNIAKRFGASLCELMNHEKMRDFIQNPPNDPPYDLVITEYFGSVCYLGFGHLLKTPVVIAISSMQMPYVDEFMANPLSYASRPGMFYDDAVLRTFWDRLRNVVTNFMMTREFFFYTRDQTEVMRKYLGQDVPDVRELERRVALSVVNTHYTFHGVRPSVPAVVEVAGIHIEEDESKLTPELEAWLNASNDGLVYFTLGSLINIETLPEKTIFDLYASFKKIAPIKVLMKCADKTKLPAGLPKNVLTSPWIPQIPVLRHKNTRVFITHGGLMGSQEALYYGVPIIGIPVFADQVRNINIFVEKNMAVLVDIENINEETMDAALSAVLNDPKYRESAKRESAIFRDRPVSAMDTAMYWLEYVIRNGPDVVRSPAVHLYWWEHHLIDVYVFLISCFLIVIYSLVAVIKFLKRSRKVVIKKKRN